MEEKSTCEKKQNGTEWTTSVFLMLPWASEPPGALLKHQFLGLPLKVSDVIRSGEAPKNLQFL